MLQYGTICKPFTIKTDVKLFLKKSFNSLISYYDHIVIVLDFLIKFSIKYKDIKVQNCNFRFVACLSWSGDIFQFYDT